MLQNGPHDLVLVAFSIAMSVLGAYSAVDLAGRSQRTSGNPRLAWLAAAAVTMGGGMWCMHFVSMLAFAEGTSQFFDLGLTFVSLAVGIVVSGVSFVIVTRKGCGPWGLVLGGIVMGGAIAALHYSGMAAEITPSSPDVLMGFLSIVIGVSAATGSMWLSFRGLTPNTRMLGSLLLGASVTGTHYVALLADQSLHICLGVPASTWTLDQSKVGLIVAGVTSAILVFGLMAARADQGNATVSKAKADALEESEAMIRKFYRTIPMPHHALDGNRALTEVSDRWLELMGFEREAIIGRTLRSLMTLDSAELYREACDAADTAGGDLNDFPCQFITSDKRTIDTLLSGRTERDADGRAIRSLGGITDVTARKKAEEALRHSQKMEVVGQLTGGVAHDFNNVLAVIFGNLELAAKGVSTGNMERVTRCLNNAFEGAERAKVLTARLLAFSRKQPLQPTAVDMNHLVSGMSQLVAKTLGESIVSETGFGEKLWETMADRNQLENAILNLALNARDAMPDGGRLIIETANRTLNKAYAASKLEVSEGDYVMISMTDTGTGMEPDVLARAFEPFYTTKGVSRSGLGLSQVFGFVKQSGGHVEIASAPGSGTTVTLFLPRSVSAEAPFIPGDGRCPSAGGSRETVLLVEDETEVRIATAEVLAGSGYRVFQAGDATEALRILGEQPGIAVLVTDVGLPGMNGRLLAAEAVRRRPDLKVMFVTGYSWDVFSDDAGIKDMVILQKPFRGSELNAKLDGLLAGRARLAA